MIDIPFFDQIFTYKQLESTNLEAKKMIHNKEVKGNFLVLADSQSGGIGRKDNHWHSPEGGLWFTAGLYSLPLKSSLTIFVAISILSTLLKIYPKLRNRLKIKWPNDLYLDDKKLAGILTTAYPDLHYVISGIGINTNVEHFPPDLQGKVTSLSQILSIEIDNCNLLSEIFSFFAHHLPQFLEDELTDYLEFYRQCSFLDGKEISLSTEFETFHGKVKGINSKGALLLQLAGGAIQPFFSGSVIEVR